MSGRSDDFLHETSRKTFDYLAGVTGDDPVRFAELMHIALNGKGSKAMRAAAVAETITRTCPWLFEIYIPEVLERVRSLSHNGQRRNLLKILTRYELDESLAGKAVNLSFSVMEDASENVAAKVYAMEILFNLCKKHPELGRELYDFIEAVWDRESDGFKARGRMYRNALEKLGMF
jgi:hypothetical protein